MTYEHVVGTIQWVRYIGIVRDRRKKHSARTSRCMVRYDMLSIVHCHHIYLRPAIVGAQRTTRRKRLLACLCSVFVWACQTQRSWAVSGRMLAARAMAQLTLLRAFHPSPMYLPRKRSQGLVPDLFLSFLPSHGEAKKPSFIV